MSNLSAISWREQIVVDEMMMMMSPLCKRPTGLIVF